jgi:hypothetical protein
LVFKKSKYNILIIIHCWYILGLTTNETGI